MGEAHAIVVGLGSLGSPVAMALAGVGVGRLGVVDPGVVEEGDPARAPLHFHADLGIPKAQNAAVKLHALNPRVHVEPYPALLDELNGEAIVLGADLVVDCTGGLAVNDACCAAGVPFAWGSAAGYVMTVRPGESACVRCTALPQNGKGTVPSPVRGIAPVVGAVLAAEALRMLDGRGRPGELLRVDPETLEVTRTPVARRDECPSCAVPAAAGSV
jgi:molybdopterin/thiamine biosynthesis adenylyltransferase